MKQYGHTKTLFIQGGKYKWSYKYDYCIECKMVKFKHKGKGLCTSCFDKERKIRDKKRKFNLVKQSWKHYYKNRLLLFLEKKEHKKKKINFTKEMQREYQKQWYQKNKTRILQERKLKKRKEEETKRKAELQEISRRYRTDLIYNW